MKDKILLSFMYTVGILENVTEKTAGKKSLLLKKVFDENMELRYVYSMIEKIRF